MKYLRARRPVVLLTVLAVLLLYDHSGFYRISLTACLLHESGHILAWLLQHRRMPVLRFSLCGICMEWDGVFVTPVQELWLAAAGPLANFAVCCCVYGVMQWHASYFGYFFASANLWVGLFNLLPLGALDGRRILGALLRAYRTR